MNTIELLDRLEILNPTNTFLSDLRRLIVDDDRNSLYRLIATNKNNNFINALRKLESHNDFDSTSLSRGQIYSKQWLISELEKLKLNLGTVFICAGWYAILAYLLFQSNCNIVKIRSFDIDSACEFFAETFNKEYVLENWKFKASTLDICDMKYPLVYKTFRSNGSFLELTDMPDTIINTSCEHIVNFRNWFDAIPINTLVVLQTNNYFEIAEHVNCSKSLQDFSIITPLQKVLFEGELEIENYTRFMRIGYK